MAKEKLTWRSFTDVRDKDTDAWGRIASAWKVQGTPTLYVLDHKGVIRHKWVGSPGTKTIHESVEKLIEEAEGGAKKGWKQ